MNAYSMLAEKLAQSLADLAAYHERNAQPRNRDGSNADPNAFDLLEWGYAHKRAVAQVVRDNVDAYTERLSFATTADDVNSLFSNAARDAIDASEHAARNPHQLGQAARRDALCSIATALAGRDYRKDATREALRLLESTRDSYARQLAEYAPDVAELCDEYAHLGGDKAAFVSAFVTARDAETARRKDEAKREAARARRAKAKGDK